MGSMTTIDWLLDSDPAIRWQVMRDLTARAGRGRRRRTGKDRDRGLGRAAARAPGARRPAGAARRGRTTGPTRSTSWSCCAGSGSTRERAGPPGGRPRPRARHLARSPPSRRRGPTIASSRARSSRASTATSSRRARTSAWTWRRSSSGSSASSSPTAAGTARSRTARRCRRSGRRSTSSRACSSTSGRSAARPVVAEARRRGEEYMLERRLFRRKSTGRGDRSRAGSSSRSRPGTTTTSCAGSTTCATPGSSPTSGSPRRSESSRAIGTRRPLAAPERPRGRVPFRDGGGGGPAEPLEHPPRAARARLVRRSRLADPATPEYGVRARGATIKSAVARQRREAARQRPVRQLGTCARG